MWGRLIKCLWFSMQCYGGAGWGQWSCRSMHRDWQSPRLVPVPSLSVSFRQALKAGSAQKNRLPTSPSILLTPLLFLHHFQPLLLPQASFLLLLVLPALVEVLHHDADEHVQDKEADNEQEGDEVEQHPGIVVSHGLRGEDYYENPLSSNGKSFKALLKISLSLPAGPPPLHPAHHT